VFSNGGFIDRLIAMQDVRTFLLHGGIQVGGRQYANLATYYCEETKSMQKGHYLSVQNSGVAGLIASPGVGLEHTMLNSISACVCDAVHWGLLDLAAKLVQPDPEAVVRSSG
jgi:hypothetical protein